MSNPTDPQVITALSDAGIAISLVVVMLAGIIFVGGAILLSGRWYMKGMDRVSEAIEVSGKNSQQRIDTLDQHIVQRFDNVEAALKGIAKDVKVLIVYQDNPSSRRRNPGWLRQLLSFEHLQGE